MSELEETAQQPFAVGDLPLLLAGGAGLYFALSTLGPGLTGPAYLLVFSLIWLFLTVLHVSVRRMWRDSFVVSIVAALVLAAVSVTRYRWGLARGMRSWDFLILLTILGCASFFLRAGKPSGRSAGRDGYDTAWWTSSCGGSSDSGGSDAGGGCGGGCGGGGCGGCGGG
jgi:hypothetical protein